MPWPSVNTKLASLVILAFALGYLSGRDKQRKHDPLVIASPLKTALPKLSPSELQCLAYPPDALPGARDVETPFGSLRTYEWGPEDGQKVLLVHGISTPSVALGRSLDRCGNRQPYQALTVDV